MKRRTKVLTGLGTAALIALSLTGCATGQLSENQLSLGQDSFGYEMTVTNKNQEHLDKVQPPPMLTTSAERTNLINYTKLWNDPNRVSYIYLLNQYGAVIAYYTVKGKVSSTDSELTDPTQVVNDPNANGSLVVDSPQMDGSYGTNGNAIFFFTTDGQCIQWDGQYVWSTTKMKLSQPPLMTAQVNAQGSVIDSIDKNGRSGTKTAPTPSQVSANSTSKNSN